MGFRLTPAWWNLCVTARLCCCVQAVGNCLLAVCNAQRCAWPAGCYPWPVHGSMGSYAQNPSVQKPAGSPAAAKDQRASRKRRGRHPQTNPPATQRRRHPARSQQRCGRHENFKTDAPKSGGERGLKTEQFLTIDGAKKAPPRPCNTWSENTYKFAKNPSVYAALEVIFTFRETPFPRKF